MTTGSPASTSVRSECFDAVVLPHLDAARRLARRLMRDQRDAEDAVQEASLRALRYFRTFSGGDGRAWFLRIVRNACYGWRRGFQAPTSPFDEEHHSFSRPQKDPEALLRQTDDANAIARAMSRLADPLHQVLVLRELEGLSYSELSEVIGIPIGTVMSRLSRARVALRRALQERAAERVAGPPFRKRKQAGRAPARQSADATHGYSWVE
ncbi:MAG TPA: sigma-70 family RNA polymerase sigma factor [Vicinamibacterales bacterium]|nr:sigma-70 family RNA polymerase sigma factor [Vicinamibacterales bacterium]